MAITKEKKKKVLDSLKGIFENSKSVVFVNFKGLNVEQASLLRRDLKQSEVGYKVAKKTLVKKTLSEVQFSGDLPPLEGELSLAFGDDLIEPARKIFSFSKKIDGKISIIGGIFDGVFMDREKMTDIAQIPGRETLYAQFVNIINSPIQGLAVALSKISEKK